MKSGNLEIRELLCRKLIGQNAFWSYDMAGNEKISDDILILKTLIHLDIDDIGLLFRLFPRNRIKKVWREQLVIQGDYYRNLNIFFAWLYFDIRNPEKYLRTTVTKHINKLKACTD